MSTSFSYLNFGRNWDQINDNGNTMSESAVTKNVRSRLNTPPWHLLYKELKDNYTVFVANSDRALRYTKLRTSKYLFQNYYCSVTHQTM